MYFFEDTHEYLFPMDDDEDFSQEPQEEYLTYDQEMEYLTQYREFDDDERFSPVFPDETWNSEEDDCASE